MGRNVQVDGLVYCDWRINVHDCVDSGFFYIVNLIIFCLVSLGFVVLVFDLFLRHYGAKDPWSSYKSGMNFAAILFTFFSFVVVIHEILLLFVRNQFATGIIWSFTFPLGVLPLASYFYSIIGTFHNTTSEKVSKTISENSKILQKILIGLWFCLFGFQAIFLIVSEYFIHANYRLELSNQMFVVALAMSSLTLIGFAAYECYFAYLFLKVSSDRLKIISAANIQPSDNETSMVQVAIEKLRGNVRVMIISTFILASVFLSMAIEPEFFANLVVSKIFCILSSLVAITPFILSIFFIIIDTKKTKIQTQKKKSLTSYYSLSKNQEPDSKLSTMVQNMEELKPVIIESTSGV